MARSHIAIVDDRFVAPLLKGVKRIETRFSRTRRVPFGSIFAGDIIHFKVSGGDIIGHCRALSVIEYDRLTPAKIDAIRRQHNHAIQAPRDYWHNRSKCLFGVLIRLGAVSTPAWSGPVPTPIRRRLDPSLRLNKFYRSRPWNSNFPSYTKRFVARPQGLAVVRPYT